jgi:hypothetical protein
MGTVAVCLVLHVINSFVSAGCCTIDLIVSVLLLLLLQFAVT